MIRSHSRSFSTKMHFSPTIALNCIMLDIWYYDNIWIANIIMMSMSVTVSSLVIINITQGMARA